MKVSFEIAATSGKEWELKYFPTGEHHSTHATLLDAVIARQELSSGETPPFDRWLVDGVEEVSPTYPNTDRTQSRDEFSKTLNLRRWEYEEISNSLHPSENTHDQYYSNEFETRFHYSTQQRSTDPLIKDHSESDEIEKNKSDAAVEATAPIKERPIHKKYSIIYWTIAGCLITMAGSLYKKYRIENPTQPTILMNNSEEWRN
jgi:hypothetical protein